MNDDLLNELQAIGCHANGEARCTCIIGQEGLDGFEALTAELDKARDAAVKHLRRAEKAEIASADYANFSHEWRHRAEAAEAERDALAKRLADFAPMRCAECTCEKGGSDCNWILTPKPDAAQDIAIEPGVKEGLRMAAAISEAADILWNAIAYDKRQAGRDDNSACDKAAVSADISEDIRTLASDPEAIAAAVAQAKVGCKVRKFCPRCGSIQITAPMATAASDDLHPVRIIWCRGCWHQFRAHTPDRGSSVKETIDARCKRVQALWENATAADMEPIPGLQHVTRAKGGA